VARRSDRLLQHPPQEAERNPAAPRASDPRRAGQRAQGSQWLACRDAATIGKQIAVLRVALPPRPADDDAEESVKVAEAARRLGCATSTVRDLLDSGQLSGHRVGKGMTPRGVRVHAVSIRRYKARHAIGAAPAVTAPASIRISRNPAAAEARRRLRELGVL
jgi:excisionase family DNA binding protein